MTQWEYCEVDFGGSTTSVYFYDEAGEYIDHPAKLPRLGDHFILMAQHIERKQNRGK